MVLDNVAYHHARKIRSWLNNHPKLVLFFLPPYSPNLNAAERAWYMRKKSLITALFSHWKKGKQPSGECSRTFKSQPPLYRWQEPPPLCVH
jgi:transposase